MAECHLRSRNSYAQGLAPMGPTEGAFSTGLVVTLRALSGVITRMSRNGLPLVCERTG